MELPTVAQMFDSASLTVLESRDVDAVRCCPQSVDDALPPQAVLEHELRIPVQAAKMNVVVDALAGHSAGAPTGITPTTQLPHASSTRYSPDSFTRAPISHSAPLSAFTLRTDISDAIATSKVVLISGPPGSGKSTVVPQVVLGVSAFDRQRVLSVSKNALCAAAVAGKVAQDMGVEVGGTHVGVVTELEQEVQGNTQLVCCNAATVLRMLCADANLSQIGCVILDGFDTLSADSDVLFSLLLKVLTRRSSLKIVLTCRSANPKIIAKIADSAVSLKQITLPTISTNSVEKRFLEDCISVSNAKEKEGEGDAPSELGTSDFSSSSSFLAAEFRRKGLRLVLNILSQHVADHGAISGKVVIFLPSWTHIQIVGQAVHMNQFGVPIIPVHPDVPKETISKDIIFKSLFQPGGAIVLACNALSTDLPVMDASLVIDAGHTQYFPYDPSYGMYNGDVSLVSKQEIANRTSLLERSTHKGALQIYHFIPKMLCEQFLKDEADADILQQNLAHTLLLVKAVDRTLDINDFFDNLINKPGAKQVEDAIVELSCRALYNTKDGGLTLLGALAASVPLPLAVSKILVFAVGLRCLDAGLTAAASLLAPPIFAQEEDAKAHQNVLAISNWNMSDHLTELTAFAGFAEKGTVMEELQYCHETAVHPRSAKVVRRLRAMLLSVLQDLHIFRPENWNEANLNRRDPELTRSCITAGLYPHVALCEGPQTETSLSLALSSPHSVDRLAIHPKSVCTVRNDAYPEYLVYTRAFYTTVGDLKVGSLCGVSRVDPLSIVVYSGAGLLNKAGEMHALKGRCRGWFAPEATGVWAKTPQAEFVIGESRAARGPHELPENPTPANFVHFSFGDDNKKHQLVLDKKVKLSTNHAVATLAIKVRKAVVAAANKAIVGLKDSESGSPGLFASDLSESLGMLLVLTTNPAKQEQELRAEHWRQKGVFESELVPVFGFKVDGGGGAVAAVPQMHHHHHHHHHAPFPPPMHHHHHHHHQFPPMHHHHHHHHGYGAPNTPPPLPVSTLPPSMHQSMVPAHHQHHHGMPLPPSAGGAAPGGGGWNGASARIDPEQFHGELPSLTQRTIIDELARSIFENGSRDAEDHVGDGEMFRFLKPEDQNNTYYEWKLKNLAFLSEKPEVPKKGSQEEQRRAELRRQYLETHNNNTAETHPPVPESAEEGEEEVQAGFNFVGKDMMPAPAAGAEPMSFTMAKPAPSAVQMPYPPAGTSHPPLPPLPPPSSFAPPPMTEPIRPTRVIRRPTSPRVLPEVVPAALTEGEVADMDVSDVVRYESERLRLEMAAFIPHDITQISAPPASLIPKKSFIDIPEAPLGPPVSSFDGGMKGATKGIPFSQEGPPMPMGKGMWPPGMDMLAGKKGMKGMKGGEKGMKGGVPHAGGMGGPSVLVGPIPSKQETRGSNLPLILAKALGEAVNAKVGPTLIVGQEARIDVPSLAIEERAVGKEFFVCLGRRINIQKNDRIQQPEGFLADRLKTVRQRVGIEEYSGEHGKGDRRRSPPRDRDHRDRDRDRDHRDNRDNRDRDRDRRDSDRDRRDSDRRGDRDRDRDRDYDSRRRGGDRGGRGGRDDRGRGRRHGSPETKRQRTDEKPLAITEKPGAKGPPDSYKCPKCKQNGHWVKDCPTLKK